MARDDEGEAMRASGLEVGEEGEGSPLVRDGACLTCGPDVSVSAATALRNSSPPSVTVGCGVDIAKSRRGAAESEEAVGRGRLVRARLGAGQRAGG